MALEIPIEVTGPEPGELTPHVEQTTELDGVEFGLRLRWNDREQRWYLDLSDVDGAPILLGVKLVANWSLLRTLADDGRRPRGELVVVDTTGEGDPRLPDLGRRVRLIYVPVAEVPA